MTDTRPILPTIDPLSYLRTAVPALWGSLLAFLAAQVPFVAAIFVAIDAQFGEGWRQLSGFIAAAAVIFAYYWVARQIGRRWPAAEKWLIGSSAQPIYFENASRLAAAQTVATPELEVVPASEPVLRVTLEEPAARDAEGLDPGEEFRIARS